MWSSVYFVWLSSRPVYFVWAFKQLSALCMAFKQLSVLCMAFKQIPEQACRFDAEGSDCANQIQETIILYVSSTALGSEVVVAPESISKKLSEVSVVMDGGDGSFRVGAESI